MFEVGICFINVLSQDCVCIASLHFFFFNVILMKKGSIISEASYIGDQQKTLMEVLSYCQVFLFLLPSHGIETILGKLQEDLKSVFDKLGLQPFQLFTCWLSHNCYIFNEKNNLSLYSELLTP